MRVSLPRLNHRRPRERRGLVRAGSPIAMVFAARADGIDQAVRDAPAGGDVAVAAAPIQPTEQILHLVTDPNVAYLLLILGVIGLLAELYNPGLVVPGLVGVLSLILAFMAFAELPLSGGGLALLLLGVALMIAELHAEGFGVLGIAGVAAFLLGSLSLYQAPGPGALAMEVNPWLLALMAATLGTFLLGVMRAALRSRREKVVTGIHALRGRAGSATSELAPKGTVEVDRESWSARAVDGPIHRGEPIVVVDVKGVILEVARQTPADRQEDGRAT